MRIVFFGSDNFAVASLQALLDAGYDIACIITQPDKGKGRGLALSATPVKSLAAGYKLQIRQPSSINKKEEIESLKGLSPDLFVVIAYGQILSEELLVIPHLMSINLHASLLPKYRGAAPINWAIINGEDQTGVSTIKIIKKMDAGPLIMQRRFKIEEQDTTAVLTDKLSRLGAGLLLDSIKAIERNDYTLTPQREELATLAPKLKKQDGLINWSKSALEICNLIRGCSDWPGAFTYYQGKLLKILKAKSAFSPDQSLKPLPAEIIEVTKNAIVVATGKGNLIIEELQPEGKRAMKAEEFLSGRKISAGEILGKK